MLINKIMSEIKYIFICENFTICTGINNVQYGIEIKLKELFLNKDALEVLKLITIMCDVNKPDYTFEWVSETLLDTFIVADENNEEVNGKIPVRHS